MIFELNRSSAKFLKIAILTEFAGFVKIAALLVPLSQNRAQFVKIFSPNSPDLSKSLLRRNSSPKSKSPFSPILKIAEFERRIRQNRAAEFFVGTPISSSIAFWRNSSKFRQNRPPLSRRIRQNHHSHRIRGFVKIAASSVPLSRAESLFAEIRRHSRRICQNRRFVCTPILS